MKMHCMALLLLFGTLAVACEKASDLTSDLEILSMGTPECDLDLARIGVLRYYQLRVRDRDWVVDLFAGGARQARALDAAYHGLLNELGMASGLDDGALVDDRGGLRDEVVSTAFDERGTLTTGPAAMPISYERLTRAARAYQAYVAQVRGRLRIGAAVGAGVLAGLVLLLVRWRRRVRRSAQSRSESHLPAPASQVEPS
jgi:hypothetical protein